jgi:hypothetical protein
MPEDTYELLPEVQQRESALGTGLRTVARLGARAAESVIGLPGDLESLGRRGINAVSNIATGKNAVDPEAVHATSQSLRQAHKPYSGEYLEPQGEGLWGRFEKSSDEFAGDLASAFITGGTGQTAKRILKITGLANAASFLTRAVTGSESAGDAVKFGSLLVVPFIGRPKADALMRTAYNDAYKALPEGATVSAKGIKPKLDKLSELIGHGISTPENQQLATLIKDVEAKIQGGTIPLRSADMIKKQINSMIYSGSYGGKGALHGIEKLLPTVTHSLNEAIGDYAKTNPAFGKPYQQANELFAAINGGPPLVKWVEKHITPDKALYPLFSSLFKGYGFTGAAGAAAVLALPPALRSGTIFFKSPTIRNQLFSTLKAAAAENVPAFARAVNKLERQVTREYPEWYSPKPGDEYEIID